MAELVAEKNDDGLLALSVDERAEAKVYVAGLSERISVLQEEKRTHMDAISAIKKDIAAGKKASKALEKAHGGARIKSLRRSIEKVLKTYKIDRGAHHGGDLVGGACRLLMQHTGMIFADMEMLLLAINRSNCESSDEFGAVWAESRDSAL